MSQLYSVVTFDEQGREYFCHLPQFWDDALALDAKCGGNSFTYLAPLRMTYDRIRLADYMQVELEHAELLEVFDKGKI